MALRGPGFASKTDDATSRLFAGALVGSVRNRAVNRTRELSFVWHVALCGTFSERSVAAGSRLTRIRSTNHVLRRHALALAKTLNLLVEGSIPSGLTNSLGNLTGLWLAAGAY